MWAVGRAGIPSKFYKCGLLEGKGNKALQLATILEFFRCGWLTRKGTAVKLWEASHSSFDRPLPGKPLDIPTRPLDLKQFFHSFRDGGGFAGRKSNVDR
jgi:hypothetical protein